MEKTLNEIAVGRTGTVVGFAKGIGASRQKLLAMGLIKGTEVKVVRVAPMGDPVEISWSGISTSV
jgi:ferrous iron transport protein A